MLLVRPKWLDGESWPGYLLRLAHLNGLPALAGLTLVSGITRADLMNQQPAEVLANLGVVHDGTPVIELGISLSSRAVPPRRFGRFSAAICPLCIRTDPIPYFRAKWEWPLEVECEEHAIQLVPRCHRCHEYVNLRYGTYMVCRCGVPYRDWHAKPSQVSSAMIRKAIKIELPINADQTFQAAGFRERAAFTLLRNIAYSAGLRSTKNKNDFPRLFDIDDRFEVLRNAAPWFENWPESFVQRLHIYRWMPGNYSPKLLNPHSLRASVFSEIDAIWEREKKVARRSNPVAVSKTYLPRNPGMISLMEASRLLGVSKGVINVWLKNGKFPNAIAIRQNLIQLWYTPRTDVEGIAAALQATLSFTQAAKFLGLTYTQLRAILRSQVLTTTCMGLEWRSARLDPAELKAFKAALLKPARKVESVDGLTPFAQCLITWTVRQGPLGGSVLLNAMLQGELRSYRKTNRDLLLSDIYLSRADVRRFNLNRRCELALSP